MPQLTMSVQSHPYREFERTGWELAASSYADSFEAITSLFSKQLLEAVGAGPGSRIVDVACGSGPLAGLAAAEGALVEGVDFSPNMIAVAKERFPGLSFRVGDAEALPFPDDTFDAVVIGFGVHHFPFPMQALSEGRRVLRHGGRLGFTVWAPMDEHILQRIIVDAVREVGNTQAAPPVGPGGPICDTETCLRLLRESGFDARSTSVRMLALQAPIESARKLIDLLIAGTVRMSTVIRSLPEDKIAMLVEAVTHSIEPYRDGVVFRIPVAALLATATKH
ncbi:Methyltransferase domain-containing protein [Burkholderia sp. YR290]|nr:Methyltransferase domain-containing protein [Burkholderia sp. YR290]